jgi:myo-inositol-1-phosphate synthase
MQCDDSAVNWNDLGSLSHGQPGVTPSRVYFRLAIELNAQFINFTPNICETPALQLLAQQSGIMHCGRDGKTGQTFFKTLIAPGLRDKNFRIDGWFSTNLLGNNDGRILADPDSCETKRVSKAECLESILGYSPGAQSGQAAYGHQIHIHFYPPRGDAKEAWDNIDFSGFLGNRMQLKINLLGQDSILAAPCLLDLIRLCSIAAEGGRSGPFWETAYFFKSPLPGVCTRPQHGIAEQFELLLGFLRSIAKGQPSQEYSSQVKHV